MRNWKKYYNDENKHVKTTLKRHLNRLPDVNDYNNCEIIKKLNSNLIDIYHQGELIHTFLSVHYILAAVMRMS